MTRFQGPTRILTAPELPRRVLTPLHAKFPSLRIGILRSVATLAFQFVWRDLHTDASSLAATTNVRLVLCRHFSPSVTDICLLVIPRPYLQLHGQTQGHAACFRFGKGHVDGHKGEFYLLPFFSRIVDAVVLMFPDFICR
jgi:hypothetical protein